MKAKLLYAGIVITVVAAVMVGGLNHQIDGDYDLVLKELENIPDIEVLNSGTFDEEFTVTNIFATIKIKNDGILTFQDLHPGSFKRANSLQVSRIGDWGIWREAYSPRNQARDYPLRSGGFTVINLVSKEPIAHVSPKYNIHNVAEAVVQYKDILDFVENLPDFQNKVFEEGSLEPACEEFGYKDCRKSEFFKWVTWKFRTNCLGTSTGGCNDEKKDRLKDGCLKEWGDNYSWCQ